MQRFIIVKYASLYFEGEFTENDSIVGSYTARECGVTTRLYASEEEAASDLEKLKHFNPTVDYGIVPVQTSA